MTDDRIRAVELFAWIGEDELGSGVIGLKQGLTPAGCVPLVATERGKVDRAMLRIPLAENAAIYGKTIRLCRFVFVEELVTLEPKP